MKRTYDEFLTDNKKINLFDEPTAILYYRLLKMGDIQTALSYLIATIEQKIGWLEINISLQLLNELTIYNVTDTQKLLSSRLDNFVINPSILGILQNINGNYLLTDMVSYDSLTDDFIIEKENYIFSQLTFTTITQQSTVKQRILLDLQTNANNYSLDFIVRLCIYKSYFDSFTSNETLHLKIMINSLFDKRRKNILKSSILYLNDQLYNTSFIFSRLNLLKDHTVYSYNQIIRNAISKTSPFHQMLLMLDVFE